MEAHVIIMFGPHLSIGLFVSSADPVFLGQDLRVLRWNCFVGNGIDIAHQTFKITCELSELNISKKQKTVRVGDAVDCGAVL